MKHIKIQGKNISFEKAVIPYYLKNGNGETVSSEFLEIRKDPVTSLWNKINPFKDPNILITKKHYLERIDNGKESCPFCKENINNYAKFSMEDNSYKFFDFKGNSLLISAKKPYSKFHGIIIPNIENHTEFIDEISYYDFHLAFQLAREFFRKNIKTDSSAKYTYINLNHTLLAGASVRHLHFHLEQDILPTNYHRIVLDNVEEHFSKYKSSLLEDYVYSEKDVGDRFIYEGKTIIWVANFSPFGNYDIFGLVKSFGIINMAENNFRQFTKELYNFLTTYTKRLGIIAFNLSILDSSFIKLPGFYPIIRIIARPFDSNSLTTKEGYVETIHIQKLSYVLPEDFAKELRLYLED